MLFQIFWPQTDSNTPKSSTTYCQYLQFLNSNCPDALNSKNRKQINNIKTHNI